MSYLRAIKRLPAPDDEQNDRTQYTWATLHHRFFTKKKRNPQKWNELKLVLIDNGIIEVKANNEIFRLFD